MYHKGVKLIGRKKLKIDGGREGRTAIYRSKKEYFSPTELLGRGDGGSRYFATRTLHSHVQFPIPRPHAHRSTCRETEGPKKKAAKRNPLPRTLAPRRFAHLSGPRSVFSAPEKAIDARDWPVPARAANRRSVMQIGRRGGVEKMRGAKSSGERAGEARAAYSPTFNFRCISGRHIF